MRDGHDTLHDSTTTDGLKQGQRGHHENGQGGREDLKQDGETILSATCMGPAWLRIAIDTGICGNSSARGSSLRSETNPGMVTCGKWWYGVKWW